MTFVVIDECDGCKDTTCVAACPVAGEGCFVEGERMLYIDPKVCIDCGACVPECPVEAIYDEVELPEDQQGWLEKNRVACESGLPAITEQKKPLGESC